MNFGPTQDPLQTRHRKRAPSDLGSPEGATIFAGVYGFLLPVAWRFLEAPWALKPFSSPKLGTFLGMSLQLHPVPFPWPSALFGFGGICEYISGYGGGASCCSSGSYFKTAPRAAFLVLRGIVQRTATEKEERAMEKPGLGWRRVDGEVC